MNVATVKIAATSATIIDRLASITAGMVGATVAFVYAPEWEAYTKTAVFRYKTLEKAVVGIEDVVTIPPEMLTESGEKLLVGVYGISADGQAATPTVWVTLGRVQPGADAAQAEGVNQALPVWAQILAMIGQLGNLKTSAKDNLVAAINELVESGVGLPSFGEADEGKLLCIQNGTAQPVALGPGLEIVELNGVPTLRLSASSDDGESVEITVQIVDGELVVAMSGEAVTAQIQDGELTVAAPEGGLTAEIVSGELYVKEV